MSPVLIAVLVAGAVGLVAYRLLATLFQPRPAPTIPDWPLVVGGLLGSVSVPGRLARAWSDESASGSLRPAGLPWPAEAYSGLRWVSLSLASLLAVSAWLAIGPGVLAGFLVLISMAAGVWGPPLWLQARLERRTRQVEAALPAFLDRLTLALEAGLGFDIAMRRSVASIKGALGTELRRALFRLDVGQTKAEVMRRLTEDLPSAELRAFAASVQQAEKLGTSLASTLRIQNRLLRSQRRRRAQEASRRLPVLIVFPLVFFFLPSMLIIYLAPPLLHLFLGR